MTRTDLDNPTADLLRGALHRGAADLDLTPPGPQAVRAHAQHRARRHRQVVAGITGVALVAGGFGLARTVTTEPGIELAPADQVPVAPDSGLDLTWRDAESLLAAEPRIVQDADGVLYALSTSPGVTWEDTQGSPVPQAIYRSTDGASWGLVTDLGDQLRLSGLEVVDGVLYGVTTAPGDNGEITVELASSGDGQAWDRDALPPLTPAPTVADGVVLAGGMPTVHLVDVGATTVVVTERYWWLEADGLAEPSSPDAQLYMESAPEGVVVHEVTQPAATGPVPEPTADAEGTTTAEAQEARDEVVATIPWDEVGLTGPGDLQSIEVHTRTPDGTWHQVDLPQGQLEGVVATDDGYLGLVRDDRGTPGPTITLVRSTDGVTWTEEPSDLQLVDAWEISRVGSTVVMTGTAAPADLGISLFTSADDGRTWTTTRLDTLLEVPEGAYLQTWPLETGPLGVVAVATAVDEQTGEQVVAPTVLHSVDGRSWTTWSAEEIGAGDAAWFAWAHVGNDQIILDARRDDGSPFTVVGVPSR